MNLQAFLYLYKKTAHKATMLKMQCTQQSSAYILSRATMTTPLRKGPKTIAAKCTDQYSSSRS